MDSYIAINIYRITDEITTEPIAYYEYESIYKDGLFSGDLLIKYCYSVIDGKDALMPGEYKENEILSILGIDEYLQKNFEKIDVVDFSLQWNSLDIESGEYKKIIREALS